MQQLQLTFGHLFPEIMNLYGDIGNVMVIKKRCEERGIKFNYIKLNNIHDIKKHEIDITFFGGGQDNDQMQVYNEFCSFETGVSGLSQFYKNQVESGKVFLLICGGYQMFGNYFIDGNGNRIEGLGILNINTTSLGNGSKDRNIGNIVIESTLPIHPKTLVGFENHSGQTEVFIDENLKPLGTVIAGFGNSLKTNHEGCYYKNVFGSYMHGALLPKNPHFADYLIEKALEQKYKKKIQLKALEDELELQAHAFIISEYGHK